MKLSQLSLFAVALSVAPLAAHAGVDIGVNIGAPVVAEGAPPPPRVEVIGTAPGPDYFWVAGHWTWNGGRWVWLAGSYRRHPHFHPGGGWEQGHWDRRGNNSVWVEGRWH